MSESPYREVPIVCARCAKAIRPEQVRNRMCRQCDAIRSIQIGITLNDRFGAILRGTGLEGRYAVKLAVGEAEQMYPEIWAHFDNAREALAADRIEVADYDTRRRTQGAIVDVQGNGTVFYLNANGHADATAAGRALQAALPDVDWQALDRAETAQIARVGALTIPKWKQWLVGTAIVVGVIVLFAML